MAASIACEQERDAAEMMARFHRVEALLGHLAASAGDPQVSRLAGRLHGRPRGLSTFSPCSLTLLLLPSCSLPSGLFRSSHVIARPPRTSRT